MVTIDYSTDQVQARKKLSCLWLRINKLENKCMCVIYYTQKLLN